MERVIELPRRRETVAARRGGTARQTYDGIPCRRGIRWLAPHIAFTIMCHFEYAFTSRINKGSGGSTRTRIQGPNNQDQRRSPSQPALCHRYTALRPDRARYPSVGSARLCERNPTYTPTNKPVCRTERCRLAARAGRREPGFKARTTKTSGGHRPTPPFATGTRLFAPTGRDILA